MATIDILSVATVAREVDAFPPALKKSLSWSTSLADSRASPNFPGQANVECAERHENTPSESSKQYECHICWSKVPGEDFEMCLNTIVGQHGSCRPCLTKYWESLVNEGRVEAVGCAGYSDCSIQPDLQQIRKLLSERSFRKYVYFLRKMMLHDENVIFCGQDMCWEPIFMNASSSNGADADKASPNIPKHYAKCLACQSYTCAFCSSLLHGDELVAGNEHICLPYREAQVSRSHLTDTIWQRILSKLACQSAFGDDSIGAQTETSMVVLRCQSSLAPAHGYSGNIVIKYCPVCKTLIERIDGCDQMICETCRFSFCWTCLKGRGDQLYHLNLKQRRRTFGSQFRRLITSGYRDVRTPTGKESDLEDEIIIDFVDGRNSGPFPLVNPEDIHPAVGLCACNVAIMEVNRFHTLARNLSELVVTSAKAIGHVLNKRFAPCYSMVQ